jgi:hypothetical protein
MTGRAPARLLLAVLLGACNPALTAAGQAPGGGELRVDLGLEPERVTVGQPFHVALRVHAPSGVRVEYGDFPGGDTLQAIAPVELAATEAGGSAAIYALVAWVAGAPLEAAAPVRLVGADGVARDWSVPLRLPEVVSVLPPPAEQVEPRPAKGLVVPLTIAPITRWWLALLLGALAAVLLAYWLLRRPRGALAEPPVDPRLLALAQLDEAGSSLLGDAGQIPELYRRVSWILRRYLALTAPALSLDLTTTELLGRAWPEAFGAAAAGDLRDILAPADRVKFARHTPAWGEARALLRAARAWVASYPPAADHAAEPRRAA